MFKKIVLSVCAVALAAYLSLWGWANHWIDSNNELNFKKSLLPMAKGVWKITPSLNADKDADRFLKIASFSVLSEDLNKIDHQKLTAKLKDNYQLILDYYNKNQNKLSDSMKSKFALKKLIFINRSVKAIKDNTFEASLVNLESEIAKLPLEEQATWYNELITYYMIIDHNIDNKNIDYVVQNQTEMSSIYYDQFIEIIGKLNGENNTKDFKILYMLYSGIKGSIHTKIYLSSLCDDQDKLSETISKNAKWLKEINQILDNSNQDSTMVRKILANYLKNDLNIIDIKIAGGDFELIEKELTTMVETLTN